MPRGDMSRRRFFAPRPQPLIRAPAPATFFFLRMFMFEDIAPISQSRACCLCCRKRRAKFYRRRIFACRHSPSIVGISDTAKIIVGCPGAWLSQVMLRQMLMVFRASSSPC